MTNIGNTFNFGNYRNNENFTKIKRDFLEKYDYENADFTKHMGEFREFVRKNYEDEFVRASFDVGTLDDEYKDIEKNGLLGGLIQDLLEDDNFFDAINIVDDGKISDQEISAFLKSANNTEDEDEDGLKNTSFDEVLRAYNDVMDGKIGKEDFKKNYTGPDEQNPVNPFVEQDKDKENPAQDIIASIVPKDYSQATKEELNTAIVTESGTAEISKTVISYISKGDKARLVASDEHLELATAIEQYEDAKTKFKEATQLTDDEAKRLDDAEQAEVDAQVNRDNAQLALDENQVQLLACQTNIKNYEGLLASANAELSAIPKDGATDVQNQQRSQLEGKISDLNTKITKLKEEETRLLGEQETLKGTLADCETALTTAQENVIQTARDLASSKTGADVALQNYITARNNYDAAQEAALQKERANYAGARANQYSAQYRLDSEFPES